MLVLVVNAPHNLLHDIAHGHNASCTAMLVNHHGDFGSLFLHDLKQLHHGHGLGNCGNVADDSPLIHRDITGHAVQVLHVHEAHNVIFATAANGIARVLVLADHIEVLLQRVFKVKANHVDARRHDGTCIFVAHVEDVIHNLILLFVYETAFGALINEQLDLIARVNLVLVGRIVPRKTHHEIRNAIEHPHDGIRHLVKDKQRRG